MPPVSVKINNRLYHTSQEKLDKMIQELASTSFRKDELQVISYPKSRSDRNDYSQLLGGMFFEQVRLFSEINSFVLDNKHTHVFHRALWSVSHVTEQFLQSINTFMGLYTTVLGGFDSNKIGESIIFALENVTYEPKFKEWLNSRLSSYARPTNGNIEVRVLTKDYSINELVSQTHDSFEITRLSNSVLTNGSEAYVFDFPSYLSQHTRLYLNKQMVDQNNLMFFESRSGIMLDVGARYNLTRGSFFRSIAYHLNLQDGWLIDNSQSNRTNSIDTPVPVVPEEIDFPFEDAPEPIDAEAAVQGAWPQAVNPVNLEQINLLIDSMDRVIN